ncbi:haloalkane dehalogenase [Actinospongicola halichondriae]|uniref:haloalkane dehalogenase n=1 Tax=Actinospongicola halichondriae TaxID=3236844 RepID=UPI003D5B9685
MEFLRTPDERFAELPGYPFPANFVSVDGLRMHFVDEGPSDGPVVLLLHGEPSWSYLYRHMIPVLTAAGYHCIAPDLIGFGKSDKPVDRSAYTYDGHVAWLRSFVEALDLREITLFCQDWGGLLGLRLVAETDRFARVVAANTTLPVLRGVEFPPFDPDPDAMVDFSGFLEWVAYSQSAVELDVGAVIQAGTATDLSPAVMAAYDAPFPDESYRAGARQFPLLVPTAPDANEAAWAVLDEFDGPFLTIWATADPVVPSDLAAQLVERIPGAKGQPHSTVDDAFHFLQEDQGAEIARRMVDWLR